MCHNKCCSILAINNVQLNDITFDFGYCVRCFSPFLVFLDYQVRLSLDTSIFIGSFSFLK